MAVYRFRVSFEDHEDLFREIDILGKQNFEDLHRAIQEAIGFDNLKDASFFMSDDHWRKGREIVLRERKNDDDDDDDYRKPAKKLALMAKSRVVDFIDDPHQKILYIYDPQAQWTMLIELVRILTEDAKAVYPRCSRSVGVAPKQYKVVAPPPDVDEDDAGEEDEGPKKERVFAAEEAYDENDHDEDASTEGDEESEENSEGEESEGGGEEEGSGFGFGEESSEDY